MDNFHNTHDDEFCVAIIEICFHSVQNCPLNHHMKLFVLLFPSHRIFIFLNVSEFIMLVGCVSPPTNGSDQYFILMNTTTIDIHSHCIGIMIILHFQSQNNSKGHNQCSNTKEVTESLKY